MTYGKRMNLFGRAKITKPGKDQSVKVCFLSTGNMLQISDRKRESSRTLEDICKGESLSILPLGRNRFFRGDFDSVKFPGRFTKIWGRKAKKPRAKSFGERVPEGGGGEVMGPALNFVLVCCLMPGTVDTSFSFSRSNFERQANRCSMLGNLPGRGVFLHGYVHMRPDH